MEASITILASKKHNDAHFENPLKDLFDFMDRKIVYSVEFVANQNSGNRVCVTFTDGDKVHLNDIDLNKIETIQTL